MYFTVCIVMRVAVGASVWKVNCMFVYYVHHVTVLNAASYMTCSLLMLVKDERGYHMNEAYSTASLLTAL